MSIVAAFVLGAAAGGLAAWLLLRERASAILRARDELATSFQALSAEALRQSTSSFLDLAKDKIEGVATAEIKPIKESLVRFDEHVRALEQTRQRDQGELARAIELLRGSHDGLKRETAGLATALRRSDVRGRWGEMQLRRSLELAGMLAHCDFVEQPTASGDEGLLRPDVVVHLPGGKHIVVDAKAPLPALLDAGGTDDEAERARHMATFARHVRDHMTKLSGKAYWRQFSPSPEFVVMFLPGESFFRAAVEHDQGLLESGPGQRVILASPTTLITLLFAAAAGWRDQTLAENARKISEDGRELYERLRTMGGHFAKLGAQLGRAVESYNSTVGSLETRVLPAARRFPELGVSRDPMPELATVDVAPRPLTAAELAGPREVEADAA